MKLVDSVPWQERIVDAPPIRLQSPDLVVADNLDLTFVAASHTIAGGAPDYLADLFAESQVFFFETAGWRPWYQKTLQRLSDGDYRAREHVMADVEQQRRYNEDLALWTKEVFRQLYDSRVKVVLPDYPAGHPGLRLLHALSEIEASVTVEAEPVLNRDKFILNGIGEGTNKLRGVNPKIASRKPLKGLGLFGVAHYGIHDAMAATAEERGLSFTSELLFEEQVGLMPQPGLSLGDSQEMLDGVVQYQNYIRTP